MKERGTTLIEFIIAGTLSITFFAALLLHYRVSMQSIRNSFSNSERTSQILRIIPHISRVVEAIDSYRLDLTPRIISKSLTFTNGTPIPTASRNHSDSEALAYAESQPLLPARLTNKEIVGGALHTTACFNGALVTRDGNFDALGITPEGIYEVTATVVSSMSNCSTLTIYSMPTIVTAELSNDALLTLSILIPLAERNILFTDSDNTLRLIRMHKNLVIENQPLISHAPLISLNHEIDPKRSYKIVASLHFKESVVAIPFRAHLSRESSIQPLLGL